MDIDYLKFPRSVMLNVKKKKKGVFFYFLISIICKALKKYFRGKIMDFLLEFFCLKSQPALKMDGEHSEFTWMNVRKRIYT